MKVAIRADASVEIGTGHLRRCLTLADELKRQGGEVLFICRSIPGELASLILKRGHRVVELASIGKAKPGIRVASDGRTKLADPSLSDARATEAALATTPGWDWLVVDHYGLDAKWELRLKSQVSRIMVIDDMSDRPHECELLLDQNCAPDAAAGYISLVPASARLLLGPEYSLVAPDFAALRSSAVSRRSGDLKEVLVFMGGTDPFNETLKALSGLAAVEELDLFVTVVVGASNPHRDEVQDACARLRRSKMYVETDAMASLMATADLAIGSGGTATWERCVLGLPALVTILAENQRPGSLLVERAGGQRVLGWYEDLSPSDYADAILRLGRDSMTSMARSAARLCDGAGAARVAQLLGAAERQGVDLA